MTDICPDCDKLREAIDEPLLAQGYLPTETVEETEEGMVITLRKDRREPSEPYRVKTILISEVLVSYPGYELVSTASPSATSVKWVLRKVSGKRTESA